MADATIDVTPYDGSLLATELLSSQQTILLSDFDSAFAGTLTDNDGNLSDLDDGIATFNGDPVNYIGSGTVQPGVDVLGVVVPLGEIRPVVIFEAGGQLYFHFPDGPPNILGAVALVVNISPAGYSVFNPVCFTAGTMILTPSGERQVEEIEVGDLVTDMDGASHEVVWVGGRQRDLPIALCPKFARWLTVRIPAESLGPNLPARDLLVSQQHRVLIEGAKAELLYGEMRVLVPAIALVGDVVRIERSARRVSYHHLLCAQHVILVANGMPAESLLVVPQDDQDAAALAETLELIPETARAQRELTVNAAYPVIRTRLGSLLRPTARTGKPPEAHIIRSNLEPARADA
jgi:hypothetical protein